LDRNGFRNAYETVKEDDVFSKEKDMAARTDTLLETQFPRQPYKAGLWLIATLPLVLLVVIPLNAWVHRQAVANVIGLPLLAAASAGTAYLWANSLVKRSGWSASWLTGVAGAIGFLATIIGVLIGGYDPLFGSIMKLLNITQTVAGTHDEFYVVFVVWTGLVTGGCGLAVGLALKQPGVALKLLGLGLVCGAVVFLVVALAMEALGFRVGTPRPDGLPSMPIVTILGIWVTALIGSELFGRVLARHR
jgi:hypothetical protein